MANIDAAFGWRPIGKVGSGVNNGGTTLYTLEDNANLTAYKGDHVMASGGYIVAGTASGATNVGVFNGCQYTDPTTGEQKYSNYYPASTNATDSIAFVIDDPNVVFEIQCNAAFPVADLLGNFDIVYTSSGSTVTGISGAELNVSDGATTATLSVKAIDITEDPDNDDVSSDATNVYVVIQNHIFGQKSAGLA